MQIGVGLVGITPSAFKSPIRQQGMGHGCRSKSAGWTALSRLTSLRTYYPLAEVSGQGADLQGMGNPKSKKGEPEGSPFETLEEEHKEEQI